MTKSWPVDCELAWHCSAERPPLYKMQVDVALELPNDDVAGDDSCIAHGPLGKTGIGTVLLSIVLLGDTGTTGGIGTVPCAAMGLVGAGKVLLPVIMASPPGSGGCVLTGLTVPVTGVLAPRTAAASSISH